MFSPTTAKRGYRKSNSPMRGVLKLMSCSSSDLQPYEPLAKESYSLVTVRCVKKKKENCAYPAVPLHLCLLFVLSYTRVKKLPDTKIIPALAVFKKMRSSKIFFMVFPGSSIPSVKQQF